MISEVPSNLTSQVSVTHSVYSSSLLRGQYHLKLPAFTPPLPWAPPESKGKAKAKDLPANQQAAVSRQAPLSVGRRKGQKWGKMLVSMDIQMLLSYSICPNPERQSADCFCSLTYLFKRLPLPAKCKCCPKIRTYKVSLFGSEGFQMGRVSTMKNETWRQSRPWCADLPIKVL